MSTVTIAEARERLDELCDSVAETGEPVRIEHNGRTVQLVPTDEEKSDPEMLRRLYAAKNSVADDNQTITTTFADLCKAFDVDASKL